MKLVAHDRFNNPIIVDVTSVVVLDDHDNPVVCAISHQPGHIQAAHVLDQDFDALVSMLGFDEKVVVVPYGEDSKGKIWQSQPNRR